ncbi:hypothetical protein Scep_019565 [Stephania cephalantha]|uniref:Retrovirus-related Pol polyprotein from transposon TNT 1-94-like beta-barrel domain-containing protein n=1 Tax=Stephania cephalantha TaxID=152367 RepID=A0AAP0NPY0_9MAGN
MRFNNGGSQQPNMLYAVSELIPNTPWYADSGATAHLAADPSMVTNSVPYAGNNALIVGDGQLFPTTGVNFAAISSLNLKLSFHNILCVPNIKKNLLSVSQ